MVQAERLAAIGQTIAALSHHIKNILQGLRSGSEILKMGLGDKDEVLLQKGWKIVEKNQAKIYELVMDMLSYSKEREPAIEETDINEVVADVADLLENKAKEMGVKLEVRPDRTLPLVQVDPEGLHRALLNVMGNALEAVEDRKQPQVQVTVKLDGEAGWARIEVLDNGGGVAPEKAEDIFRPFVSTKGSKGTGLGLPVSRKILREHGGDIIIKSELGKGSKFVLRMPIKSPLGTEGGVPPEATIPERPDDTIAS
jgi:signal transduction histidine kinase